MGIITWIIIGGLAGWLASVIVGSNSQQGCLVDIGVGVVGALVGGFLFSIIGGTGVTGFNLYSLLVATIGAIVFLLIVRAVTNRK
jgi:uncharacterized membrane protein YeaQ/YmgE (transglycosylase-associated protein family)